MKRLAIITSHPIQYNAPWFKMLSERKNIAIKVFYTWGESVLQKKFDPGFGKVVTWDIPLLEGYDYSFVNNVSTEPGTHHFKGIINPTLNKEIEDWKADAILVFGWAFVSHLKCIRYFKNKIPVFFRGDSTLLDEAKGIKTLLRRMFLKWVYRKIDFALYVGTNNKNYFLKHNIKDKQLVFAPHAIDNDRFAEPHQEYNEKALLWRSDLSIEKTDIVILFAGKFENKKNPLLLLQLAEEIKSPNVKFVFVGNGVLEDKLIYASQYDSRIKLIDFVNQQQMPLVYRLADIFILPSKGPGETWGLALNEAMASGRAVVATKKVGGACDLIVEDKNGFIIEVDDLSYLVSKIKKIMENKDVLNEWGQFSKQHIAGFSFENIVTTIEKLINLTTEVVYE